MSIDLGQLALCEDLALRHGFRIMRPEKILIIDDNRERLDDLSLLVSHFLRLFLNEMGMSPPGVTPEALALLEAYTFPGNVRELKNVIERAVIESGGEPIRLCHIHLLEVVPRSQTASHVAADPSSETIDARATGVDGR